MFLLYYPDEATGPDRSLLLIVSVQPPNQQHYQVLIWRRTSMRVILISNFYFNDTSTMMLMKTWLLD